MRTRTASMAPPYAIGSDDWPGTAKASEESGELVQVVGKIMAYPVGKHPDGGARLRDRLIEELGDAAAAIEYCAEANGFLLEVQQRKKLKLRRFWKWHREERQ